MGLEQAEKNQGTGIESNTGEKLFGAIPELLESDLGKPSKIRLVDSIESVEDKKQDKHSDNF